MLNGNFSAIPNFSEASNVKAANKSTINLNNYTGPNFGESLREVARSARMQIANGSTAASLQMFRQKEGFDKLFNFQVN